MEDVATKSDHEEFEITWALNGPRTVVRLSLSHPHPTPDSQT